MKQRIELSAHFAHWAMVCGVSGRFSRLRSAPGAKSSKVSCVQGQKPAAVKLHSGALFASRPPWWVRVFFVQGPRAPRGMAYWALKVGMSMITCPGTPGSSKDLPWQVAWKR